MKSKVLRLIGEDTSQTILSIKDILKYPDYKVTNPIVHEKFEININTRHVFDGRIMIQGELIKNIVYKAIKEEKNFVAHKTIVEPFEIEFNIPNIKKTNFENEYTGKGITNNLKLDFYVKDIQSDTQTGSQFKNNKKEDCNVFNKKLPISFKNSSLEKEYIQNIDDKKSEDEEKESEEVLKQDIVEKVLIKIKVEVSEWVKVDIPFYYPPQDCKNKGRERR